MQRGWVDSLHPPFTFLADLFYNLYFPLYSSLISSCYKMRVRVRVYVRAYTQRKISKCRYISH